MVIYIYKILFSKFEKNQQAPLLSPTHHVSEKISKVSYRGEHFFWFLCQNFPKYAQPILKKWFFNLKSAFFAILRVNFSRTNKNYKKSTKFSNISKNINMAKNDLKKVSHFSPRHPNCFVIHFFLNCEQNKSIGLKINFEFFL